MKVIMRMSQIILLTRSNGAEDYHVHCACSCDFLLVVSQALPRRVSHGKEGGIPVPVMHAGLKECVLVY